MATRRFSRREIMRSSISCTHKPIAVLAGVFVVLGAGMARTVDPATPVAAAQTTPATRPATGNPIEYAAVTTAEILIVPTCPPPGEPLYPAGTTMTDTEIVLPEGATEAWFDVFIKNWALTGMGQSANNTAACAGYGACCTRSGQTPTEYGCTPIDSINNNTCTQGPDVAYIDGAKCKYGISNWCNSDLFINPPTYSDCYISASGGNLGGLLAKYRPPVAPICGPNPTCRAGFRTYQPIDQLPHFITTLVQTGLDMEFSSVVPYPGVVDIGTAKYVFTLKISAAEGWSFAPGSLTVEVSNDPTETGLSDQWGRAISPWTQIPAIMTVLAHRLSGDLGSVAAGAPCAVAPPANIPAVSTWGLLIIALVLLAAAKLRWRRASA